ncbi:MAG: hypothetical protein U0842_24690 [Candidatus Binatia bacterium]
MAAVALAVGVLGAGKGHALTDDPFTSFTQPANALVMPFDETDGHSTFFVVSNINGVSPVDNGAIAGVTTHWAYWSENCNHLADVYICLTLNDTVVVSPSDVSAIDAANNPIGPKIDLSGNRGFVVVTAYATDEICSDGSIRGNQLVDNAIVGTYTFANTDVGSAFGNDAIGLGTFEDDFTELPPMTAFTDYSIQTFNPEDLGDSEVVLLALRERGGYGDTANQEVGPYNPLVGGISADLIYYDNLEIPTSLPSVTFKCAKFTSLIPGEESLIPDTISLLSSGILRLNNLSPALVPGTNDRTFAYGVHGQAVGQYGGSSNLKYKATSLD